MHSVNQPITPQQHIASPVCSPHEYRCSWLVPAVLLLAATAIANLPTAFAQTPFVEITNPGDLGSGPSDFGASWGDFDLDGDMDIFVTKASQGLNYVYRNEGSNHFTRMTAAEIGELAGDLGGTGLGLGPRSTLTATSTCRLGTTRRDPARRKTSST